MGNVIERITKDEYLQGRCEICGLYNFNENTRGTMDICTTCFWIDDTFHKNANEPCRGPNGKLSVNSAKSNFRRFGASDRSMTFTDTNS